MCCLTASSPTSTMTAPNLASAWRRWDPCRFLHTLLTPRSTPGQFDESAVVELANVRGLSKRANTFSLFLMRNLPKSQRRFFYLSLGLVTLFTWGWLCLVWVGHMKFKMAEQGLRLRLRRALTAHMHSARRSYTPPLTVLVHIVLS